jgi:nitronate monooxygenase
MGTRFVATRESVAAEMWKKAIVERGSEATTITDAVSGLYARYMRNAYSEGYRASGAPVLPALIQTSAAQDVFAEAGRRQDPDYFPMPSGQSVGLIRDLPGAAEVVEAMIAEACAVMAGLPRRVRVT